MKFHIAHNMMERKVLALVFLLALPSAASTAGSVAGSVVDDSGHPVASARVFISSVPLISRATDLRRIRRMPSSTGADGHPEGCLVYVSLRGDFSSPRMPSHTGGANPRRVLSE